MAELIRDVKDNPEYEDLNANRRNSGSEIDYGDNSINTTAQREKLKAEVENYRQECYDLRRKVELQTVMLNDLQGANESLEQSLKQKLLAKDKALRELEDKYRSSREDYEASINNLEAALSNKSIEINNLKELLAQHEEIAAEFSIEQSTTPDNTGLLEQRIEDLVESLQDEVVRRNRAEQALEELKEQYSELQNASLASREHLREVSEALDSAREELVLLRTELNTPKACSIKDETKGNSLFAEVEDRRKEAIDKFATLKNKYVEAKNACKARTAEVKRLRAEKAAILKRWETEFVHNRSDDEELLKKYKSRITDLETKLNAQIRKNMDEQVQPMNPTEGIFQALLTDKERKIQDLHLKIEDLSTKLLIEADVKHHIDKRMRFWKCKALSLEAQAASFEAESESSAADTKQKEAGTLNSEKNESEDTAASSSAESLDEEKDSLKKTVRFSEDTKDTTNELKKPLKRQPIYPILYIPG